ncbi:MAG: ribokinase [Cyclobacteriaceae bacterium]
MKILNFGSVNIDYVYEVPHFVQAGETLPSTKLQTFIGGKGCNQSVALARSGMQVYHAGCIGEDGIWIKKQLDTWGVNTSLLRVAETVTGHAIIQVSPSGENAIVLHGGANHSVTSDQIDQTLAVFEKGDILLLQNEINSIPDIISKASAKQMTIFFNPAPMTKEVLQYPLDKIDTFIVNAIEGKGLTGMAEPEEILRDMNTKYPDAATILTLGAKGAISDKAGILQKVKALNVTPVDTTAAGDTFIGYFLGEWASTGLVEEALDLANRAAAKCVVKKGGATSIPDRDELT